LIGCLSYHILRYLIGKYHRYKHLFYLALVLPSLANYLILLFNKMKSNYWTRITGEKNTACYNSYTTIITIPMVDNTYQTMKYILAIGVLKGISCVSTHYKCGLLLFNKMKCNYWTRITGEKNTACYNSYTTIITIPMVDNTYQTMKYLWQLVCWKVFHVSLPIINMVYCSLTEWKVITGLELLAKKVQLVLIVIQLL